MQTIKNPVPATTGNRAQFNADSANHTPKAANTKSRSKAIDRHCKDCIYDPIGGAGTWREQVKNCTNQSCALFNFRPLPTSRVVVIHDNPTPKSANFHCTTDSSVCGG